MRTLAEGIERNEVQTSILAMKIWGEKDERGQDES
jgi:hypothetical protein